MSTIFDLEQENRHLRELIDNLWRQVVADRQKSSTQNRRKFMLTETQKAQEVSDAYNALKTTVASDKVTIAGLQQQIANGTPVTADQLGALGILDTTDAEVEADNAAAAGASTAPASDASTTPAATAPTSA